MVKEFFDLLVSLVAPVVHLNEKLFYTTNRKRTIIKLYLSPHEPKGTDFIAYPKILSRRFPVKSMFLDVVARPQPDHNFDGKIFREGE